SLTNTRRVLGSTAMPWTLLKYPGRVSFGGLPFCPHAVTYLPALSNFTTRVPLYPSATTKLPSGNQSRYVGRLKCLSSAPGSPYVPIVCTFVFPSCVNRWTTCL